MFRSCFWCAALVSGCCLAGEPGGAEREPSGSEPGPSEAERLFRSARALVAQKKYQQAFPLFEASQHLEPALGTLLNLADCLEKLARWPEAFRAFSRVAAQARASHDARRGEEARGRADALASRLALLSVEGVAPGARLEISTLPDEAVILSVEVDAGLPVALLPGEYRVRLSAHGRAPFERTLLPLSAGQQVTLVAPLEAPKPALALEPVVEKPAPGLSAMPGAPDLPVRPLAVTGVVAGSALALGGVVGVILCQDVVNRVNRQQPGGPDASAPTVTRGEYNAVQVLYPLSIGAAAIGVAAAVVGGVFWRAPLVGVSMLPTSGGALGLVEVRL